MAGSRRYRSGFCNKGVFGFILTQPNTHCPGLRGIVLIKLVRPVESDLNLEATDLLNDI